MDLKSERETPVTEKTASLQISGSDDYSSLSVVSECNFRTESALMDCLCLDSKPSQSNRTAEHIDPAKIYFRAVESACLGISALAAN